MFPQVHGFYSDASPGTQEPAPFGHPLPPELRAAGLLAHQREGECAAVLNPPKRKGNPGFGQVRDGPLFVQGSEVAFPAGPQGPDRAQEGLSLFFKRRAAGKVDGAQLGGTLGFTSTEFRDDGIDLRSEDLVIQVIFFGGGGLVRLQAILAGLIAFVGTSVQL